MKPSYDSTVRQCDGLTGSPGKRQKEGQDDQGTLKLLGVGRLALLPFPGPPGLPSGSSLGSLELPGLPGTPLGLPWPALSIHHTALG